MTLRQLTHSFSPDIEFDLAGLARRAADLIIQPFRLWAASRQEDSEMLRLDYRERADLATRLK